MISTTTSFNFLESAELGLELDGPPETGPHYVNAVRPDSQAAELGVLRKVCNETGHAYRFLHSIKYCTDGAWFVCSVFEISLAALLPLLDHRPLELTLCEVVAEEEQSLSSTMQSFARLKDGPLRYQLVRRGLVASPATAGGGAGSVPAAAAAVEEEKEGDPDRAEMLRRLEAHLQRGLHAREVTGKSPPVSISMWKDGVLEDGVLEDGVLEDGVLEDDDGDGRLVSEAEFVAWHEFKTGRPPGDRDLKLFYAADEDGNGEISAEEFEVYKLQHVKAVVNGSKLYSAY